MAHHETNFITKLTLNYKTSNHNVTILMYVKLHLVLRIVDVTNYILENSIPTY